MQEIQFLEFMGGSNIPQALPNYLICLCFIRISRYSWMPFAFQPALRVPQQPHKRSHSNDSFVAGWVGRVHMPLTPFLQSLRTTT